MNQGFSASVRDLPEAAVIDLRGEINAFADQELSSAYDLAEGYAKQTIVLNFKEVSYINSTGIALIVGLLARARKSGWRLAVFGLSDHYQEIFQITRLADFMSIYSDEASLMAELG